jgi:hypothetical protein
MTNLKTAAHNLLATLQAAAKKPDDVKVAIVPFATDVNADTANVSASWIDWTDWEAANGTCSNTSYTSKSSCESHTKVWTPAAHSTWNGCVYDRDQNNDVTNTATMAGAPATLFRAHHAANCPAAMMPLSNDWTSLNSKIDAMTPAGNTNVTIGLAWGFQLLSPIEPFNAPAVAPDLDKVMVILTDGQNTQNRWSSRPRRSMRAPPRRATTSRPPTSSSTPCASSTATPRCCGAAPPSRPCFTTCSRRSSWSAYSALSPRTSRTCVSRNSVGHCAGRASPADMVAKSLMMPRRF